MPKEFALNCAISVGFSAHKVFSPSAKKQLETELSQCIVLQYKSQEKSHIVGLKVSDKMF
jgi:hypothetical protein